MSEKRRDRKGRVLRAGESQRADLTYQFRYVEGRTGERKYIYAPTLEKLRVKEDEIKRALLAGINPSGGKEKVIELVERYMALKIDGLRPNTIKSYKTACTVIRRYPIANRSVASVKYSDAKAWLIQLSKDGLGKGSIQCVVKVIKPAFQMAVEDDTLSKNPFVFSLKMIPDDAKESVALSVDEQKAFLKFLKESPKFQCYYDQFAILLGTGLRVSELAGLTFRDVDFEAKRISISHQLVKGKGGAYISPPKTRAGTRYVPLSDSVVECFKRVIENRPRLQTEVIIDGYAGFLFINKRGGTPKMAETFEKELTKVRNAYNEEHSPPLPYFTPHDLRHTFCTNMAELGMDVKHLQYIMGHSSIAMTLNVYRHVSLKNVEDSAAKQLAAMDALHATV